MGCQKIKEKFPDFLIGDLEPKTVSIIKNHLADCPACRKEMEDLNEIWTRLAVLPEEQPSENLRRNFYAMLESYQAGLDQEQEKIGRSPARVLEKAFEKIWPRQRAYRFAFTLVLLLLGFAVGQFIPLADKGKAELVQLRQEVQGIRQMAALSMLKQTSSSDRLMGVSWSSQLENPDQKTLQALLDTLNNDANVNVRLSAVDALYLFSSHPLVKEGIIQALRRQDSPLVQIALIDLIVEIREKRAVQALKELIKNEKLNPQVKEQAQLSLQELI